MSFFKQPKPRRFHHVPIYYNEHSDRVKDIQRRAMEETGKTESHKDTVKDIRGHFSASESHLHRYAEDWSRGAWRTGSGALLVIILVLVLIWIYLSR